MRAQFRCEIAGNVQGARIYSFITVVKDVHFRCTKMSETAYLKQEKDLDKGPRRWFDLEARGAQGEKLC